MIHFNYIKKEILEKVFYKLPNEISIDTSQEMLEYSLGATLYMPATKENIDKLLLENKYPELSSLVICMEDSIGDDELEFAEENLIKVLRNITGRIKENKFKRIDLPLIFIRARSPEQFKKTAIAIDEFSGIVVGFVFPKFEEKIGKEYIKNLDFINFEYKRNYFFMPILESKNIAYKETRMESLLALSNLFSENRGKIVNVRIGSTDFSSYFGLRRNRDFTVYDIHVIRDCITDIINFFMRNGEDYTISGSVWEYFEKSERILKPQIRSSIFSDHLGDKGIKIRKNLIDKNLDGFIREILLDKENGLIGKTVIHPSHISLVNSLYVVTHEEYLDALSILKSSNKGAIKSEYSNKMNEIKPHTNWAKKILKRAWVYGVFNKGYDFVSLLSYRK